MFADVDDQSVFQRRALHRHHTTGLEMRRAPLTPDAHGAHHRAEIEK
jgi:hypothetical protein